MVGTKQDAFVMQTMHGPDAYRGNGIRTYLTYKATNHYLEYLEVKIAFSNCDQTARLRRSQGSALSGHLINNKEVFFLSS